MDLLGPRRRVRVLEPFPLARKAHRFGDLLLRFPKLLEHLPVSVADGEIPVLDLGGGSEGSQDCNWPKEVPLPSVKDRLRFPEGLAYCHLVDRDSNV